MASWASLIGDDDDDTGYQYPLIAQQAQASVGREAEASRGWQEVLPRRGPMSPAPALPPRPIPASSEHHQAAAL